MNFNETSCCGLDELANIGDDAPEDIIEKVALRAMEGEATPLYIFSGIVNEGYCEELARYIDDNKLGSVVKSIGKRNPNSGNRIKAWIWAVNKRGLLTWAKGEGIERPTYDRDW